MFTRMVTLALTIAVLGNAQADDAKDARVRKAKAALALAGSSEKAPMPKLALLSYAEGTKLAIEKEEPLIVFHAGCPRKECPRGAVCAEATKLTGFTGACVVISYPVGDKLKVSDTLPADATTKQVKEAFDKAVEKANEANPSPKTLPLPTDEWFITADVFEADQPDPPKLTLGTTPKTFVLVKQPNGNYAAVQQAVTPPKLAPQVCTGPECGQGGRPVDCKCGPGCPCVGAMSARAAVAFTGGPGPRVFNGRIREAVHGFASRVFGRFRR